MYNKNTEKEQMFLNEKEGTLKVMREIAKELKVLAVFEKGNPPLPCKFKITDTQGEEHTINVDKITRIDDRRIQFVSYHCESYSDNLSKRYLLQYWKDNYKWSLFVE